MLYSFWNVRQWVAFRNQVLSKCNIPLLGPFKTTLLFFSLPYKIEREGGTGCMCLRV